WYAIRLKYDLDVHFRNYQNPNTLFPSSAPGTTRRRDTEIVNIVRAELPLPRSFTLAFEYQSTVNMSNLALFDYTRNVYTMMIAWSYWGESNAEERDTTQRVADSARPGNPAGVRRGPAAAGDPVDHHEHPGLGAARRAGAPVRAPDGLHRQDDCRRHRPGPGT